MNELDGGFVVAGGCCWWLLELELELELVRMAGGEGRIIRK